MPRRVSDRKGRREEFGGCHAQSCLLGWVGGEVGPKLRPGSFRRRWLSVALVALGVLALAPAGAWAGTPDQQQTSFAAGGAAISGDRHESHAQTFTAGLSGALDRVDLALAQPTSPSVGPLTVEIRNVDDGGAPGTIVLARADVPVASVPPLDQGQAFVEVPLDSPATVVAGGQYAIVAYTGGRDLQLGPRRRRPLRGRIGVRQLRVAAVRVVPEPV